MRQKIKELIVENDFKVAVEVGVRHGYFSEFLLRNTNLDILYCVDPWILNSENRSPESSYETAKKILTPFEERVSILKMTGNEALSLFENGFFDFVYLDALHDEESVFRDITGWWPKTKIGGIISGHDYINKEGYGVIQAVNKFAKNNNLELKNTQK